MKRLADALWLLILVAYVFAIPPTFHGDEAMQIYTSRDFITAFIDGSPRALETEPPYPPDSDQQLRLINGSINRYAIGLVWRIAGYTPDDLPASPGWQWALDYDTNAAQGHLPTAAQLAVARLPSTIFLALSVVVIFALGALFSEQFGSPSGTALGKRLPAYLASGLFALNPIILLNGRRAMQEGAMLFFGLLTILIAVHIAQRLASKKIQRLTDAVSSQNSQQKQTSSLPSLKSKRTKFARGAWGWGGLFILVAALTLASKHTGIIFVAAALGWIAIAALLSFNGRTIARTALQLAVSLALILTLFVACSPALWSDPLARVGDLLATRAELLAGQVRVEPTAPLTIAQRVEAIVTEPFIAPLQHYEAAFWGSFPAISTDIARYEASPFSGVQFGIIGGGALTICAVLGIVQALRRLRPQPALYAGLLTWIALTVVSLLANPLLWQRYYLPLIPAVTLLAAIGLCWLIALIVRIVRKSEQPTARNHISSDTPPQTD